MARRDNHVRSVASKLILGVRSRRVLLRVGADYLAWPRPPPLPLPPTLPPPPGEESPRPFETCGLPETPSLPAPSPSTIPAPASWPCEATTLGTCPFPFDPAELPSPSTISCPWTPPEFE